MTNTQQTRREMLWTPEGMAEILNDEREILADPTLTVRTDQIATRPLGFWEEMRLEQAAMIRNGDIHVYIRAHDWIR